MNDNQNYTQEQVPNPVPDQAPSQVQNQTSQLVEGGQFYVKALNGKNIMFSYSPSMTIYDIKQAISEQESIPIDQQRLIFQGKQLEDNKALADYSILSDSTIHLVLRLRG